MDQHVKIPLGTVGEFFNPTDHVNASISKMTKEHPLELLSKEIMMQPVHYEFTLLSPGQLSAERR